MAAEGELRGRLAFPPRGGAGFGYDPVFAPEGSRLTLAEMGPGGKERISHRARALERLAAAGGLALAGASAGLPRPD